ncbi:8-amino-7-oxononanoate synthase, partial [Akkermansiaceae bacterium]|nr:8-amino-7-oxononanoate synthase [Akkermansiaceae bacterium]
PKIIGENRSALAASGSLLKSGFLVPAIRYPTIPRGTARLRITLSAAHSTENLSDLKEALALL